VQQRTLQLLLRSSPRAMDAAEPMLTPAAHVCDGGAAHTARLEALRVWLSAQRVAAYVDKLIDCLGVECVDDMRFLREEDLTQTGMRVVERRRLLEVSAQEVATRMGGVAAAAAAAAAEAPPQRAQKVSTGAGAGAISGEDAGAGVPGVPAAAATSSVRAPAAGPQPPSGNVVAGDDELHTLGRALIQAACAKGIDGINAALDRGADIEYKDKKQRNQTALSLACTTDDASGADHVVVLLLQRGASPLATCAHGYTPLHYAIRHKLSRCVGPLIEAGSDLTAVNKLARGSAWRVCMCMLAHMLMPAPSTHRARRTE
jgi:hypothetical protein